jgi:DNA polymerase-3 subunit beta
MITINYADSELSLNSYKAEEFPQFPEIPEQESILFNQECLQNLIKQVVFAATKDDTRPIFSGVNFKFGEDGILTLAATDGCKLAISKNK